MLTFILISYNLIYPPVWYILRFHLIHTKSLAPMWPNEKSELKVLYDVV